MSESDIRVLIESLDAVFQQVTSVKVVRSRPLEKLTTGLFEDEIMVRRKPDIARLAEIPDPGVLPTIASADVSGGVSRGVIRNDQLEVFVTLADAANRWTRRGTARRCRPEARCSAGGPWSCPDDPGRCEAQQHARNGTKVPVIIRGEDPQPHSRPFQLRGQSDATRLRPYASQDRRHPCRDTSEVAVGVAPVPQQRRRRSGSAPADLNRGSKQHPRLARRSWPAGRIRTYESAARCKTGLPGTTTRPRIEVRAVHRL